jgi:hypothetical protein
MSDDDLQANFPPSVPAYNRTALGKMYDYYDRHGLVGNPLILNAILDRKPRKIRDFLKDLVSGLPTVAHP